MEGTAGAIDERITEAQATQASSEVLQALATVSVREARFIRHLLMGLSPEIAAEKAHYTGELSHVEVLARPKVIAALARCAPYLGLADPHRAFRLMVPKAMRTLGETMDIGKPASRQRSAQDLMNRAGLAGIQKTAHANVDWSSVLGHSEKRTSDAKAQRERVRDLPAKSAIWDAATMPAPADMESAGVPDGADDGGGGADE